MSAIFEMSVGRRDSNSSWSASPAGGPPWWATPSDPSPLEEQPFRPLFSSFSLYTFASSVPWMPGCVSLSLCVCIYICVCVCAPAKIPFSFAHRDSFYILSLTCT